MRAWLLVLALMGCGRADAPEDSEPAAIPGVQVSLDFTRPSLYAAPFPSDDLLGSGGIDLTSYPNPDGVAYPDAVVATLAGARGFGTSMGVFFTLDEPVEVDLSPWETVEPGSPVRLVAVDRPEEPVPVEVRFTADGGPFGAKNLLSILPVQGVPLRPDTTYVAVVRRSLTDPPLGVSLSMARLARGLAPEGLGGDALQAYKGAIGALGLDDVAGVAVFTTWDPTADLRAAVGAYPPFDVEPDAPPTLSEIHDTFCVYEGTASMPVLQAGEPPYDAGGGWVLGEDGVPLPQGEATSRLWVTVPRGSSPDAGWPVAVMVRTGGGGDRPLVDRGFRDTPGGEPVEGGTGPALHLARGGWAGFMVDGPHGGPRNPTGGDEQFLMFNVTNPVATRDNVRQSAFELALLPDLLDGLSFATSDCPDADETFVVDGQHLALLGHSMGATIAPLVVAVQPRFGAMILSGAGGSYIHNIVHKQSPLPVRPLAEAMLGYPARYRSLHEHDPFLSLLQWAAEPADPPPYGGAVDAHVLMLQGIVDTYILPPMANATSLSLGLDLAGPALDAEHPELVAYTPLQPLLPLVGANAVELPVSGNRGGRTVAVVQHLEGSIEDGHEVIFQTEPPQHQYRCFLESWLRDGAPTVAQPGQSTDPC